MPIYEPELPLVKGVLPWLNGLSKLESCLEAAPHFLLSENEAIAMLDQQREAIETKYDYSIGVASNGCGKYMPVV